MLLSESIRITLLINQHLYFREFWPLVISNVLQCWKLGISSLEERLHLQKFDANDGGPRLSPAELVLLRARLQRLRPADTLGAASGGARGRRRAPRAPAGGRGYEDLGVNIIRSDQNIALRIPPRMFFASFRSTGKVVHDILRDCARPVQFVQSTIDHCSSTICQELSFSATSPHWCHQYQILHNCVIKLSIYVRWRSYRQCLR